ncbi:MAG: GMP/IMP nucleotidase [Gammaproteobacteria bacterium]|nr:GMP/IMP nucleotidase [Gammaproteobacteria bacterium]MDE2346523.1 GMP/IMP nucleotidase [Gammaproteobacteria bacterium]
MLDWKGIHTVFMDMDGTLLDLHFDNHFWHEHVPLRYGERHGLSTEAARDQLLPRFRAMEGSLQWYCLDHWSRELELDILALKRELRQLIRVVPHAEMFLQSVRNAGMRLVLVTNAHAEALSLKMEHTRLDGYFNRIVSSHSFGTPKESAAFWQALQEVEPFDGEATLLVDDSLPVLRAARDFGIGSVVAMRRPDSGQPARDIHEFPAITSLAEILPS